jgi:hypothetical protein
VGSQATNEQGRVKIIKRATARARGLPRYFTGKPCARGHVCERTTATNNCIECKKISDARYLKSPKGREAQRAAQQRYSATPKGHERTRRYNRSWRRWEVQQRYERSAKGMETRHQYNLQKSLTNPNLEAKRKARLWYRHRARLRHAGNAIGFEGRRDYAAIGTVSNVASRLWAAVAASGVKRAPARGPPTRGDKWQY